MGPRRTTAEGGHAGRWRNRTVAVALVVAALGAGACSSSSSTTPPGSAAPASSGGSTGTTEAPQVLRVLVTNDDGVGAPGIDALVEGLRPLPDTEVTVVAPAKNQSGTGGKTTDGPLTVTDATTASGYPAKAVDGYPADTVVWAFGGGVPQRPHVVLSGVNEGQNLGGVIALSGTVGAANRAAVYGVPALASSQGLGEPPQYASGVGLALAWLAAHRADLLARPLAATTGTSSAPTPAPLENLNVPNCPDGGPRGEKEVPTGTGLEGALAESSDCASGVTAPTDDIQAFLNGWAARSELTAGPDGPTPAP
jgi:5'-nucleotidase